MFRSYSKLFLVFAIAVPFLFAGCGSSSTGPGGGSNPQSVCTTSANVVGTTTSPCPSMRLNAEWGLGPFDIGLAGNGSR